MKQVKQRTRAKIGSAALVVLQGQKRCCRFGRVTQVSQRNGRVIRVEAINGDVILGRGTTAPAGAIYLVTEQEANVELFLLAVGLDKYDMRFRTDAGIKRFIRRQAGPYLRMEAIWV